MPDEAQPHYLGKALTQVGREDEAKREMARATEINLANDQRESRLLERVMNSPQTKESSAPH
jgi:hypothetical protein